MSTKMAVWLTGKPLGAVRVATAEPAPVRLEAVLAALLFWPSSSSERARILASARSRASFKLASSPASTDLEIEGTARLTGAVSDAAAPVAWLAESTGTPPAASCETGWEMAGGASATTGGTPASWSADEGTWTLYLTRIFLLSMESWSFFSVSDHYHVSTKQQEVDDEALTNWVKFSISVVAARGVVMTKNLSVHCTSGEGSSLNGWRMTVNAGI